MSPLAAGFGVGVGSGVGAGAGCSSCFSAGFCVGAGVGVEGKLAEGKASLMLNATTNGEMLSYWLAAQGAVLVFIVIVGVYCVAMDHFERQDMAAQGQPGAAQAHD